MQKRVLITGVSGQDGSYLSELLIEKGYEVHGVIRRQSTPENQENRIAHLSNKIATYYGDVTDYRSIDKIIKKVKPNKVFNLAGQSHVRVSFDIPKYTIDTNGLGVYNMLESVKENCDSDVRFYQASSSEMFGLGVNEDGTQDENTPMIPVSPYGIAKLMGYNFVKHYRRSYGMFASNGILFNHESPRRGSNFVTKKVVKAAVEIYHGKRDFLELGNIQSKRDWGHSKDYVKAMDLILDHNEPDDFVISTGQTASVEDMCALVFSELGLDFTKYVKINPKYFRAEELPYLKGNPTKAKEKLGWEYQTTLPVLLTEMIRFEMDKYSKF